MESVGIQIFVPGGEKRKKKRKAPTFPAFCPRTRITRGLICSTSAMKGSLESWASRKSSKAQMLRALLICLYPPLCFLGSVSSMEPILEILTGQKERKSKQIEAGPATSESKCDAAFYDNLCSLRQLREVRNAVGPLACLFIVWTIYGTICSYTYTNRCP